MSPWRWLFGAKVAVLRLKPGDVVVLESKRPLTRDEVVAVREAWERRFPHLPAAVLSELQATGVVRPASKGAPSG